MKQMCIECERRPAADNHYLCYSCKKKEERRELAVASLKEVQEFTRNSQEMTKSMTILERRSQR